MKRELTKSELDRLVEFTAEEARDAFRKIMTSAAEKAGLADRCGVEVVILTASSLAFVQMAATAVGEASVAVGLNPVEQINTLSKRMIDAWSALNAKKNPEEGKDEQACGERVSH